MLSFVRDQYKPGQRMAIFTLTGSLNVLQDFTSDPEILYTALQRFHPQSQQFASSGQATSSASISPTAASTVANIQASTAPASDVTSTLSPAVAQQVIAMQSAVQSFEAAQIAYAEEQRTILTLQAFIRASDEFSADFLGARTSFGSLEICRFR